MIVILVFFAICCVGLYSESYPRKSWADKYHIWAMPALILGELIWGCQALIEGEYVLAALFLGIATFLLKGYLVDRKRLRTNRESKAEEKENSDEHH